MQQFNIVINVELDEFGSIRELEAYIREHLQYLDCIIMMRLEKRGDAS